MKTYTEQKQELLQRIAELTAEMVACDPEAHTAQLKAEMNEAAANGATDEQLAAMSQAVRLAALGADETGTKHSIAASRKQAAEKLLAELEAAEVARVKQVRAAQIKQINEKLLPQAKEEYAAIFRSALAAHCRIAALVDRLERNVYALRGIERNHGVYPVQRFSLPIPIGTDGIVEPEAFASYSNGQLHSTTFAEAVARVDDQIAEVLA